MIGDFPLGHVRFQENWWTLFLWNPYIVLRDTDHGVLKIPWVPSNQSFVWWMAVTGHSPVNLHDYECCFKKIEWAKHLWYWGDTCWMGGSYCWLHWTLAKLGSWVVDRNRLKQLQPWTICAFNVLQELLAGSWLGSSRLQGRTWLKHHLSNDLFVYL